MKKWIKQTKTRTNMKTASTFLLLLLVANTQAALTVFAAASTTDVMNKLANVYKDNGGEIIRFNFASSGALARQLDAGAPADIYISANIKWMDYAEEKGLINKQTRTGIAQNTLVLVAPKSSRLTYDQFPEGFNGRLAIGDPKSVPAGAYAQAALESRGQFDELKSSLIKAKDVRTVLLYVSRNEVEAGIVYATDAKASNQVKVLGTFPADTHPPIIYPAACLKESSDQANAFLEFLKSETAKKVFKKHGFSTTD